MEVEKIDGYCPVFKEGDKFVIDEPVIIPGSADALCLAFLGDMMAYFRGLCRGIDFEEMGLAKKKNAEVGHIRCHDPSIVTPYSAIGGYGTCLFRITREHVEKIPLQDDGTPIPPKDWRRDEENNPPEIED